MQINLSSWRLQLQTITSRCLSSECHAESLGTKDVLSTQAQNFKTNLNYFFKKNLNKSRWQKRCGRNHITYIFLNTNLLAIQAAEKIIGTQQLLVCSVCIGTESQETPYGKCPQFRKLLFNKLQNCYSQDFKKHWNNTRTIF